MSFRWFLVAVGLVLGGCQEYNLHEIIEKTPEIRVDPLVINFGLVESEGDTSVQETVTVTNIGLATLRVGEILIRSGNDEYHLSDLGDSSLEPDQESTFTVTYDPFDNGWDIDQIDIHSNDATDPVVSVDLSGLGAAPEIELLPETYDFGDVDLGCVETLDLLVKNVGALPLEVYGMQFFAAQPSDMFFDEDFAINGSFPWVLEPGAGREVTIDFAPLDGFPDASTLEVESNDPARPVAVADQVGDDRGATWVQDVFEQDDENNEADFLFVIDNSCSMSDEQTNLATNMPLFIDVLDSANVDYQIGVITTDDEALVGPVITPALPDPRTEFSGQVQVGVWGNGMERGLLYSELATLSSGSFHPYIRQDADLTVIYVSDERDQSSDTWEYYRDHLGSLKADPDLLHVHAIAGDYPTGCGTADFGEGYYEVVTDLGGSFVSVCSTNWAGNITDLAEASLREREFPLSNTPAEGTIVVTVDGVVVNEWTYDSAANSVVFDHDSIPEGGAEIIIDYAVLVECP